MFWSIVSENDILFDEKNIEAVNSVRSSNPYDYLCKGYHVENASMFGGKNFVDYNSNFSSFGTGSDLFTARI